MEPPQGSRAVPAFSPQALMALYLRGRTDELSESFLAVLRHFRDTTYHTLDGQGQRFINEFVKHFLTLFTQTDYALNRSFRKAAANLPRVRNRPDPRKVAVLSGSWSPVHSAYRITRAYVEALRGYHLTFVRLGNRRDLDVSLFQEVKPLDLDRDGV